MRIHGRGKNRGGEPEGEYERIHGVCMLEGRGVERGQGGDVGSVGFYEDEGHCGGRGGRCWVALVLGFDDEWGCSVDLRFEDGDGMRLSVCQY